MRRSPSNSPERKNGQEKPTLPVFSDFSHMSNAAGVGTIRFAIGLRENNNAEDIIARVLPLTKIVPGEVKEKKPKKKPKKVEEKVCSRPDCAARKVKLEELKTENSGLRSKVKALEGRVETVRNKITLNEKSILLAEERNDTLNGQIEEAQAKIVSITNDVEKAENMNQTLREQLLALQQEIENIRLQTEEQNLQLKEMLEDKTERKIIFSKHRDPHLANEVSVLRFNNQNEDEDSD